MAAWEYRLNLKDVFHDEARTFEEKRDEIVRRIKAAPFFDPEESWMLEIVENLACSGRVGEFDEWWNEFYDWADGARVWVATF